MGAWNKRPREAPRAEQDRPLYRTTAARTRRDWRNADEVRAAVEAWIVAYETRRPHQALGWKTPVAHRAAHIAAELEAAA